MPRSGVGSTAWGAGSVKLVQPLVSPHRHYLLTPWQTRFVFTRLGWSQVVGNGIEKFRGVLADIKKVFVIVQSIQSTGHSRFSRCQTLKKRFSPIGLGAVVLAAGLMVVVTVVQGTMSERWVPHSREELERVSRLLARSR